MSKVFTSAELNLKLAAVQHKLEVQTRKCDNIVAIFNNRIRCLIDELSSERYWRSQHITNIHKALQSFEAKLKTDQLVIRQLMYDKDNQLSRLNREVIKLRDRCGISRANMELENDVSLYCPSCLKDYHLVGKRNVAIQVQSSGPTAAPYATTGEFSHI